MTFDTLTSFFKVTLVIHSLVLNDNRDKKESKVGSFISLVNNATTIKQSNLEHNKLYTPLKRLHEHRRQVKEELS